MIVVDASALVGLLLDEPAGVRALLDQRLYGRNEELHAPHVIDLEVTQALRGRVLGGRLAAGQGQMALGRFVVLTITRYPHAGLLDRVWQLRNNVTAYDGAYVALSEMLDAPLITMDRRLANASGHHARVEVF